MARIKKFAPEQKLSSFQTFIVDDNPNSDYFRITEFKDTFTGGKNGFLIEGSEYLKESTEIKIELLDVAGNPIYFEPGNGIPEYYEGISKLVAVYIYNDTPIGLGKITILGELKEYDDNGVKRQVPSEWKGAYNVKWEKTFQINKNLANEDKVRFYRRPQVNIDEVVKPIFSGNPPTITQTGSVDGIPLVPTQNTNLSNFTLPTSYRLRVNSGNNWTGSIAGQTITFDNISYSPTIDDVVNETELIVSPPYTENNLVKSFTNEDYSITFPYIEGVGDLATALTGSFAKINITDMKTFVGDAARVKVFRRSQSNLTDYEFVQEIQLESNELLRDITTFDKKEENYGIFTQDVLSDYWVTSSNDFNVDLNQTFLYNSAKLDSSPGNYFHTSQSFSIQNGVEYTLDLNVRKTANTSGDYLKVFLSGSNGGSSVSTPITTINSSNLLLQKANFTENIIANSIETASLYFEVSGSDWYVNNVSLKASQETSFSPDEITFIQQVPKTLVTETFDYRFEFYDINNNFIPVRVETTKTFVGGNTNLFNKSIEITPDNLYFSFDSASNPANAIPPTIINFDVQTTLVTGSITYTSGAYDFFGNLIPEASYSVGGYPGYLTNWDVDSGRQPFLRVQDFTGSRDDIIVQFIRYTGEVEGVSDTFVITRVEDGKGGVSFEIVPYRGLQIKNKESKTLEVQAVRVDGINRIDLRDGLSRGFSDAKLHLLSSSLDGVDVVNTYVSLSQAITNPNFIEGISAGETGSGEIDYNAIFTRDAIDNELTLFLMDGPTSESILTSVILTDLKDGLNPGLVTSTAEQVSIKYEPRRLSPFNPTKSIVTASFQRRGTTLNPLTASLEVLPSSSIEPKTELPQFYMFYTTGAFDDTITVAVTDYLGNPISNGVPGITLDETSGTPIPFYQAVQTKQLNFEFTYTEPITSASVTANKSFFITPDGLPGQNSIVIDIDPQPVALGSNHKGEIYNYELANTDIQVTQGDLFLINTASGDPGTFTTRSITPTNIQFTTLDGDSTTTMSLAGFESMSALSASIKYDFDIYPYFTSSLITASKTQKFTKVVEGAGAIEVTLDPTAVALNADESGWISNYSLASTEVFIKQNDEFLIYDPTNAGTPGTFLTASISASGINFSEVSSSQRDSSLSGDEILHFKGFSGVERTQPSASVTYNFRVYPYALKAGVAGVPTIVSKTQTFSKVNDGSKARKVSLTTNSDTIVYDGDSIRVAPVGSVFLTATSYNTTGSAYFEFLDSDGDVIGGGSSTTTTVNVDNYLPGPGSSSFFSVNLRDGNASGPIADNDSVTVSGVQEGSTAYSVALTNGVSSVTVERDGTIYFTNSGTLIRAYKGGTELQYVEEYNEEAVDPITFLPIGTFGQFSASVYDISPFLTQGTLRDGKEIVSKSISPTEDELYASASGISTWNLPQDNTQGFITYKIDFENGRATQFIDQTFSTVFEGATGPGVVVRGEWTGSIEYIYTPERRDVVVVRSGSEGDTHYFATTDTLVRSGSQPFTTPPSYSVSPETEQGDYVQGNWEYLGQQEMFVAAKIAIFEESFVENTINVGQPPSNDPNANIVIAGSGSQPFIAVGQSGIQGFRQEGIFMGIDNNGGVDGNTKQPVLSLKSETVGGQYKSLEWDGETLTIRGSIRQTAAGVVEPSLRGTWAAGITYYPQDLVQYLGETWSSDTQHTSTDDTNVSTGRPGSGPWTIAAGAGKGVSLLADTYVIAYDATGSNPSPEGTMTLTANSSNFVDGYFKFTGGGAVFTDETSFTDGTGANTDTATFTIPTSYFSTPLQFRVGVAEGDQNEKVSDTITITAVQPGADSTPMYFITPVAGGTQLKNSGGTIELQVQKSDSTGLANLASGDIKIYSGSTAITSISGVTGTDYNPTISAAAINGTMYLRLWDTSTLYDTITLLDVTDGLGGGSFISPNLKSTRNPATNNYTPSFLSLTASFYDVTGSEHTKAVKITPNYDSGTDYMYYDNNGGEHSDSEITLTLDNGDGVAFSGTGIGNKLATKDVVVTANFTDSVSGQTLSMVETVYIISDGADGLDAITAVLSNPAQSLAASSDGTVTSYAGSGTTISIYEGIVQLNHDGVGTSNGTFKVVAVPTNITVGSISDSGNDALVSNHSSMTDVSASIQYQITGSRVSGSAFTSQIIQSLTKAVAGTAAKGLSITADSQIFSFDDFNDTTAADDTIRIYIDQQNLSGTVATTDVTITPTGQSAFNPSSLTGTVTSGTGQQYFDVTFSSTFAADKTRLPVTISVTKDGITDVTTIFKIEGGADSTPMYFITSTAGGTQIKNGSGTITLQAQQSDSTGLSNLASPSAIKIYSGSNLITTISGVTGTDYNPTIDASAIFGTMYLTLKDGSNTYDTITLLDVTDGLGGGSFISPNLKSTRNPADNLFTPTILHATASFYDTSGTEYQGRVAITASFSGGVDRMAVSSKVGDTEVVITASDGDGGSVTLGGSSVATKDIVLTAVFTDPATNQQSTINETFYIISDGADGLDAITVISTNQAHTLPADSAGTVTSYVGSGTRIEVYEGTTKLEYDGGYPASDGAFSIGNIVTSNITVDSTPTAGADYIEYDTHTNMTANQASIRYGITGSRSNGEEFRADTTQTLTKAVAGENGTSGTSGAAGAAGQAAGIVYAGEWTLTLPDGSTPDTTDKVVYLAEDDLKYVVKNETGGNTYWVCATTHRYTGPSSGGSGWVVGDVTLESGIYYICISDTADPPSVDPPGWSSIGSSIEPGTWGAGWDAFGAEFTSVATDILFAQDVYADRTINVGAKNASAVIALNSDAGNSNANPYISIGQGGTQGFGQDGIFLGFDSGTAGVTGLPKLSLYADASDSTAGYVEFDGTDFTFSGGTVTGSIVQGGLLLIGFDSNSQEHNFRVSTTGDIVAKGSSNEFSGFISASAGNIGGWGINSEGISKFETDAGSIVLSSADIEISVNDISGAQRFSANASDTLPSVTGGTTLTAASPTGIVSDNVGLSGTGTGTKNATQYLIGNSLTVGAGNSGKYKLEATHVQNNSAFVEAIGGGSQASILVSVELRTAVGPGSGSLIAKTASITAGSSGYDEGGIGYESVIKGTKISLPNGETKNVEDLKVKDTILAWNVETNQYESAKIKRVKGRVVNKVYRVTVGDNVVEVSDTHGFFYSPGWKIKVTDLRPGEDEVYVKEGDSFVKKVVDSIELISKEIEVYSLEIPTLRNYISNNIVSHNYAFSFPMSGGKNYLPTTNFTKTIDNLSGGTTYYAQWKVDYYLSVSVADNQYSAEMSYKVYTVGANFVTLRPQTSGTFVNGGGFAVIQNSTNYFRVASNETKQYGAPIGYITDLQGGLAIDALYGAGGFSPAGDVGGAYNVGGHPYTLKGMGIITFTTGETGTHGSGTVRMSAGNFTSISGTTQGVYNVNYTSTLSQGGVPQDRYATVVASGRRATGGTGIGNVAPMGITSAITNNTTGDGTTTIYVGKPNSEILGNLQTLQFIILQ